MVNNNVDLGTFQYFGKNEDGRTCKKKFTLELSEKTVVSLYDATTHSLLVEGDEALYQDCLGTKPPIFFGVSDVARDLVLPRRTHSFKEIGKELLMPMTRRVWALDKSLRQLAFLVFTVAADILLLPIRLVTVIPRVLFVKYYTKSHPLKKHPQIKDLENVIVKCKKTWTFNVTEQESGEKHTKELEGEYEWRVDLVNPFDFVWKSMDGKSYALETNGSPVRRVVIGPPGLVSLAQDFELFGQKIHRILKEDSEAIGNSVMMNTVLEDHIKKPEVKYT